MVFTTSVTDVSCFGAEDGEVFIDYVSGGNGLTVIWDYIWSPPLSGNTGSVGLSAGTYTVTVTDEFGITVVESMTIAEPAELIATTLSTPESMSGAGDGTATVAASGGTGGGTYTYLWDDANAQMTSTATNLMTATYCVIVTDANACTASECQLVDHTTSMSEIAKGDLIRV